MRAHRLPGSLQVTLTIALSLLASLHATPCPTVSPVGVSDPLLVPVDRIFTSSDMENHGKNQIRLNCCEGSSGNAWCPDSNDKNPYVEIHLEKPIAIGRLVIQPPTVKNQLTEYPENFMKSFDLLFNLSGIAELVTYAENVQAIVNKTISLNSMSLDQTIITDRIRIQPRESENLPCFRMELYSCNVTSLCPQGHCINNGECSGPNTCNCPASHFGERCQFSKQEIPNAVYNFLQIVNKTIVTNLGSLTFHGDVTLDSSNTLILKPGSYVDLVDLSSSSCYADLDSCFSGFTLNFAFSLSKLDTNPQVVLTNGAGLEAGIQGITFMFDNGDLQCFIVTLTKSWKVIKSFTLLELLWYEISISWSPSQGLLVLQGNSLIGSSYMAEKLSIPATKTNSFTIGYNKATTSAVLQWKSMTVIQLFWQDVKRADLLTGSTSAPVTTPVVKQLQVTECPSASPVGISDPSIISINRIETSSELQGHGKDQIRLNCCEGTSGNAWCPSSNDKYPYVQINLEKPTAIGRIVIQPPTVKNQDTEYPQNFLKSFDLIFKLLGPNQMATYAQNIDAIVNKSISLNTIWLQPTIVTDIIRIVPRESENLPCFRMELYTCAISALCPQDYCQNGGSCSGLNTCDCSALFFGERCQYSTQAIPKVVYTFLKIVDKTIVTAFETLTFFGDVTLDASNSLIVKPGSYIDLKNLSPSLCYADLDSCFSGFTLNFVFSFSKLDTNRKFILTNGAGIDSDTKGISFLFDQGQLHCYVVTSIKKWKVIKSFTLEELLRYEISISWSPNHGLLVLQGNSLIGSSYKFETLTTSLTTTNNYIIGYNKATTTAELYWKSMTVIQLFWQDVKRGDLLAVTTPAPTIVTKSPSTLTTVAALQETACSSVSPVGISDSNVFPPNRIVTSSDLKGNEKNEIGLNCCEGTSGNAWCPDSMDKNPFVEIHLEKPTVIGSIAIQPPTVKNQVTEYPINFMKSFDLLFKLSGMNELATYAEDVDAIVNKSITLNTIWLQPSIVTDVIRIEPRQQENMPCFRMELYSCTAASLCPQNYCQNNGTCSGPNTCDCSASYFGERCQYSKTTIPKAEYSFLEIIGNTIFTLIDTLTFHGNVTLDINKSLILKPGSYIDLNSFSSSSCYRNLDTCISGFTLNFEFSFSKLDTNANIVFTNGAGIESNASGISLFFNQGQLHCYVVTSTKKWKVIRNFTLEELLWYTVSISWNPSHGLLVLKGNTLIGSSYMPEILSTAMTTTNGYIVGNNQATTSTELHWKSMTIIQLFWQDVKKGDLLTATTPVPTTVRTSPTTPVVVTAPQSTTCNSLSPVGLSNSQVIPDNGIVTSSNSKDHGKDQIRFNCCEGTYGNAWCPDSSDKKPYVEIHLEKPVAIGQIRIQPPTVTNQSQVQVYPINFMKSFDLLFRLPSLNETATLAQDISATVNKTVYLATISLQPIVTDVIRIEPRQSENLPCFRMELYSCDAASLCQKDYCQNGGTCSGQNTCKCSDSYFGEKCQYSKASIPKAVYSFIEIIGNTIFTSIDTLTFQGVVTLDTTSNSLVLHPGSYIDLNGLSSNPCYANLDNCFSGFTINFEFSFSNMDTNTKVVLTNGAGFNASIKGITLFFNQGELHCYVVTSTKLWRVVKSFTLVELLWYKISISWSQNQGLLVLQDNTLIGSSYMAQILANKATISNTYTIGYSQKTTIAELHWNSMTIIQLYWDEVKRADLLTVTTPAPTTARTSATTPVVVTAAQTTTTKSAPTNVETSATISVVVTETHITTFAVTTPAPTIVGAPSSTAAAAQTTTSAVTTPVPTIVGAPSSTAAAIQTQTSAVTTPVPTIVGAPSSTAAAIQTQTSAVTTPVPTIVGAPSSTAAAIQTQTSAVTTPVPTIVGAPSSTAAAIQTQTSAVTTPVSTIVGAPSSTAAAIQTQTSAVTTPVPTIVGAPSTTAAAQTTTCNSLTPVGLSDSKIIPDSSIIISSELKDHGKDQIRLNCCEGTYGNAWCPDFSDKNPHVEIHLEKPVAIGQIEIQPPTFIKQNQVYPMNFMKSFDLLFKLPGLEEMVTVSQDISAIVNKTITLATISLQPAIVTDVIRIEPRQIENLPCFRMELYSCDTASLCQKGYCQNGGTCSGPNTCKCSATYFGEKCQYLETTIPKAVYSFIEIIGNTIFTLFDTLPFQGVVTLDTTSNSLVLQPGSYIYLSGLSSNPCYANLDTCFSGFTLNFEFSFSKLDTNTKVILTNGAGFNASTKGISLFFNQGELHCYVVTSTKLWRVVKNFTLVESIRYELSISWSQSHGLLVLQGNTLIGSSYVAQILTNQATITNTYTIGYSQKTTTAELHWSSLTIIQLFWDEAKRADLLTDTTTTKTPDTTTSSSGIKIMDYFWNLTTITQTVTVSNDWQLILVGNPTVTTTGIELNGLNQSLVIPNLNNSCLTNPSLCTNGLTIELKIKFVELKDNTVIFSSSTETTENPGVTLLYRYGFLHAIVSTTHHVWYVSVSRTAIVTNDFYDIIVSWNQSTNLKLIINQVLIGESDGTILHTNFSTFSTALTIGASNLGSFNAHCIISHLHVWLVHIDILTDLGVLTCKLCTHRETVAPTTGSGNIYTTLDDEACPEGCYSSEICFGTQTTLLPEHTSSPPVCAESTTPKPSSPPVTEGTTIDICPPLICVNPSTPQPPTPPVCGQTTTQNPTLAPTTEAPTPKPASESPTTSKQNTEEPTTPKLATDTPTTQKVVTDGPTKPKPTTEEPTTPKCSSLGCSEPTTEKPAVPQTTENPTTPKPTTIVQTTPKCSSLDCSGPTTEKPTLSQTSQEATTPKSKTEEPPTTLKSAEEPTTPKLATDTPTTQKVVTDGPTTPKPTTEEPTTPKCSSLDCSEPTTEKPAVPQTTENPTTPKPITIEQTTPKCSSLDCSGPTTEKPTLSQISQEATTPKSKTEEPPTTLKSTEEPTTPKCSSNECAEPPTQSTLEPTTKEPTTLIKTTPAPTTVAPTTAKTTIASTRQVCPPSVSNVTLKPEINTNGQGQLTCSVSESPSASISIRFTWQIEGETTTWSRVIEAPDKSAAISVNELKTSVLNKTITCTAEIKFLVQGSEWCWPVKSNVVIPSIKCPPVNGIVKVVEGGEVQSLQVHITVPPSLLCKAEDNGQCKVEVTTTITTVENELKCSRTEIIPQAVLGVTTVGQGTSLSCGVAITSENWQNVVTIPIKATVDGIKDGDRNRKLKITVRIVGQISLTTSSEDCGEFNIVVVDRDEVSTCSSVNDPHIKTFDNYRYNNFIHGEFVMLRHLTLEQEVRSLYQLCNPRLPKSPTCNCGAAVRSGDDVITFDTCNTRQNQVGGGNSVITVDMYKNGQLTPGTRVLRYGCGQKYEVILPTGTKVTITATGKPFMNINIQASSYDFNNLEGLCGNYNNNGNDDLVVDGHSLSNRNPDAFNKKWKRETTLLKGVAAITDRQQHTYCSCLSGRQPVCRQGLDVYICGGGDVAANDITAVLISQAKTPLISGQTQQRHITQIQSRERRAADDITAQNTAQDQFNFNVEDSEQYCREYLENSTAVKGCIDHLKPDAVNQSIINCAEDLVALNDTKWAISHVEDLILECLTDAVTNVDAWENNTNADGPKLPDFVNNNMCIENCGVHGYCVKGICECQHGWTGDTCQIGSSTLPIVQPATEICDVLASSCSDILVGGDKFVSTENLKCRIKYLTIGNSSTVTKEENIVPAKFISMAQVVCPQNNGQTTKGRSALVTISNDNVTYSNTSYIHVVEKSTCQTCTLSDDLLEVSCKWKAGSCIIDNECYSRSETFKNDVCFWCNPDVSVDKWTKKSDPNCLLDPTAQSVKESPKSSSDNDTAIIVLGVLCGVLALVIVGIGIAVYKMRSSKNSKLQRLVQREGSLEVYRTQMTPSTSSELTGKSQAARLNAFYNPALTLAEESEK